MIHNNYSKLPLELQLPGVRKVKRLIWNLVLFVGAAAFFSVSWWVYGRCDMVGEGSGVVVSRNTQVSELPAQSEREWPKTLLPGERIDLNTAPVRDLQRLPEIGADGAAEIVLWRETYGPFQKTTDLMRVSGIGQSMYDRLEQYITVSEVD